MGEIDLSELNFEEISEAEFAEGGSRNGGSWNKEAIKEFAKAVAEKFNGKKGSIVLIVSIRI
jgi:hypothetical protein